MSQVSGTTVVRVPRRMRVAVGAFATVASLTAAAVWAVGAAADVSGVGGAAGVLCTPATPGGPGCPLPTGTSSPPTVVPSGEPSTQPQVPWPAPPSATGPATTRTSYTWAFEDGTPGGWYGHSAYRSYVPPWVATSGTAAASGRGGLLVGGVVRDSDSVAVDVNRTTVAPGMYTVTARARIVPGGPGTSFEINGPRTPSAVTVTDRAWATLTGSVLVTPDGSTTRLRVGPGNGCWPPSSNYAPAPTFQLDEVTLTRSGDVVGTPTPTFVCPTPTYTPAAPATAKIHYEVTDVRPDGFSATLVLTNLRDTPITGWSVPMERLTPERQITWISGGAVTPSGGSSGSWTRLTGGTASPDIPARGQVRVSLGLSGSPIDSARLFTLIDGQVTGRN